MMINRRQFLKKSIFAATAGLILSGSIAYANNKTIKVKFKPGRSSARYNGRILSDGSDVYQFKAHKGQTVSLNLESDDATLIFTVNDVTTGETLVSLDNGVWSDTLPSEGKYEVVVAFLPNAVQPDGMADYDLTILIG